MSRLVVVCLERAFGGVGFDTVKMLLDGGFLEYASTADTRDRYNLDAASVTAFAERYLAARFYAPVLECMPQFACLKLGALGVPTLRRRAGRCLRPARA